LLTTVLCLLTQASVAQSLEGVLMPGKVISGHAKLEGECSQCHVRFDRAAQDRLCLDCHKDVAADVGRKQGYHGHIEARPCRACHTEHKGREANIAPLGRFDHKLADFPLRGAHASPKLECKSCHNVRAKYRDAPSDCVACHKKDDKHKGSLGPKCADCHSEANWKQTRFDHSKTRFPLLGKHTAVECKACHKSTNFKEAPMACIGCHKKDDQHKGRFGEKCETCHSAKTWKETTFNHDTQTKYPLRGKHKQIKCESCHTGDLYRDKLQSSCVACHKKDDKHKGTLGTSCADCHNEASWKQTRFDHSKTRFPLLGKHAAVECKACHKSNVFKEAPMACIGCHKKDDQHKGRFGEKCETCHSAKTWKESTFNHDTQTKYPLRGKHKQIKCESCHTGDLYRDKLQSSCVACHKKDDTHKGTLGEKCDSCHVEQNWKKTSFDHSRTEFPLLGRHAMVECKSCHSSARYKDAKRECVACHAKDDVHKRRLGPKCETCHNARDWKAWDFNHDRKTRFPLDGGHRKLDCYACHRSATNTAPTLGTSCVSCHAADDVHDGSFGRQCERCHVTSSFKQVKALTK
jgi:hypothetical protein